MVKTQVVPKKLKSNLKGKIIKRKNVKPKVEVKNKLKKLTVTELKTKSKVEKPNQKFKIQLKSKQPAEDKPKKNYVLLQRVNVDHEQVKQGVAALYELLKKSPKKPELFDEDQAIFLQIVVVKVPETPIRHIRFHLKHTLVTESNEICLIVSDKGKKRDHESTIEHYENILSNKGITNIKTVMPFHQFKHEYGSQFELKRKLLHLYDYFLVDAPINGYVTHLLGSIFYESRKMPTSVRMNHKNLKEHFEHALKKTIMKVHSKGDSYAVQIGHTGMSHEQVAENLIHLADEMDGLFPGGFDNVRSLGVKSSDSILIPVYLTLKNNNTVEMPVCKPILPKHYNTVKGSLSTYLNASVTVTPEGDVTLEKRKIKNIEKIAPELLSMNEDDDEDDVEDDVDEHDENEEAEPDEEKKVDVSSDEQSDEENDDLAKEEEMYLNHYEHEQEEEDEQTVKNKRKNAQAKPAKKVKQK